MMKRTIPTSFLAVARSCAVLAIVPLTTAACGGGGSFGSSGSGGFVDGDGDLDGDSIPGETVAGKPRTLPPDVQQGGQGGEAALGGQGGRE